MARAAAKLMQQHIRAAFVKSHLHNVALEISPAERSADMSAYLRHMTAAPVSLQDLTLELRVRTTDRKPLLHRYGLVERVRSNKSLQVQLSLLAQGAVVLSSQTDGVLPSSRQLAKDQLAWLELPQSARQRLVDWLDAALPDSLRP